MKVKNWFKEKWATVKDFCGAHPDVVLSILGGLFTLTGGALEIYANRTEYEDNVFTTVDDKVYKIPCKKMKTCDKVRKDG